MSSIVCASTSEIGFISHSFGDEVGPVENVDKEFPYNIVRGSLDKASPFLAPPRDNRICNSR
jgi:hypothetical protein